LAISTSTDRRLVLALTALALGGFGIGTTEFATMGVLPLLADDLGASIPQAGRAVTAYALGVVVGAPLLASLTTRLPRKPLLLALIGLFAAGNVVALLAPNMEVLLGARFLSGLPHGGYLGTAAVVAASLVEPQRRGRAMARVGMGMTVANIVGVPIAAWLGANLGWRAAYGLVVVVAVFTLVALKACLPEHIAYTPAGVRREFATLKRPAVWLALVAGSIGNMGQFAVYTYVSPIVTDVAGLPPAVLPWVLALYGVGMTCGAFVAGPLIDKSIDRAAFWALGGLALVLVCLGLFMGHAVVVLPGLFLLAAGGNLFATSLQARLFRDAYDAPSLSAALNHSAFNMSNALGAFLGGVLISAGLGYRAPALLGVVFICLGVAVLLVARKLSGASPSRQVLDLDGSEVVRVRKRDRLRAAGSRIAHTPGRVAHAGSRAVHAAADRLR
jgi:DHA1 family inner membrane transport protein